MITSATCNRCGFALTTRVIEKHDGQTHYQADPCWRCHAPGKGTPVTFSWDVPHGTLLNGEPTQPGGPYKRRPGRPAKLRTVSA